MGSPFFTTNDSEISRVEGLYVKERNPPAAIAGAFLGVVGVCGDAIRGPVNKAVEITSEARFREVYGGRDRGNGGPVASSLWKAIVNKPFGKLVVVRAAAAAATTATLTLSNVTPTAIIRVDASSVGAWGQDIEAEVKAATDGNANHFNLEITYLGNVYKYKNLNVFTSSDDNLVATIGTDDGNVVVVTKLANGRPLNSGPTALSSSSDGSIADSDFTGTGKAMETLNGNKEINVFFVAERSSSALKSKIATLAVGESNRIYLLGADAASTSAASAITDAASYTDTAGRIVYCFNHAYTLDPETATEMVTMPTAWMASILSQIDVDIHPGEEDTKQYTAGIIRLYNEAYQREDYVSFREAGISALEKDGGFDFYSGVTTCHVPGKEEITRRRMTDYLQISIANFLKHSVKKKNTSARRKANEAAMDGFLDDLKIAERVVEDFLVDMEVLNTVAQRAQGIEKIFLKVKLIGHELFLVLETEIGTSVVVKESV